VDLSPGLMVSSNVRLTRPLGEGAMGCVWVAEHLTLRTQVAVKFISAALAANSHEIVARFVQEASLAAQIRSPHVVQIFDQGVMADGTPFMVMELLDGESLQSWLDRRGRLSVHEAATVVIHVARALRKAHEAGIVHRDIKPDNIFVAQSDEGLFCKVLDFGVAKQTQLPKMGLTNAGVMVGTPEYMSPEQVLSAKDVDFRADLWALAVTNYYMLTGQLPFTAEALGTLCVKLLDGKFTPASELRRDLPGGSDGWFTRALAQDPDDRFPSAREMAVAFVRLIAQAEGLDDDVSFTGVMQLPARPELGPRNKLAASGIDVTAKLEVLPDLMRDPALGPTAPLPAPEIVEAQAKSGTLTGSSSNRRVEAESKKPIAAFLGGGVAIGALVAAIVLLARPGGDATPATASSASSTEIPVPVSTPESPSPEDTPRGAPDEATADKEDGTKQEGTKQEGTKQDDDGRVAEDEPPAPKPTWSNTGKPASPPAPKAPDTNTKTPDPDPGKTKRYNHGF
jgi:eukaryotic-like serine/threonine-protein kinase